MAGVSRETKLVSETREHIQADHDTLRALWNLASHWDAEAEAASKFGVYVNGEITEGGRMRARILRSCSAELRDVITGRQK